MDDLVQFLRAQLDEDERIARAAGGLAWFRPEHPGDPAAIRDSEQERVVCDEGWPSEGQTVHIAEWDPARVLREIDAKRRLLDDLLPDLEQADRSIECEWGHSEDLAQRMLRLLALSYAGTPGYREEWAP